LWGAPPTAGFEYGLGITLLIAVVIAYVQVWRPWSNCEYSWKDLTFGLKNLSTDVIVKCFATGFCILHCKHQRSRVFTCACGLSIWRAASQTQGQSQERNDGDVNVDRAGDMVNIWSWEVLPTKNEDLAPKKVDDAHVPFTRRCREGGNEYSVHSIGPRGVKLELSHTPNDDVYNQFGIQTFLTVDMSVEEVVRKFGVLESMPSYNPPGITQSNSLPAVGKSLADCQTGSSYPSTFGSLSANCHYCRCIYCKVYTSITSEKPHNFRGQQ
jgi:hypothetical protein